VMLNRPGAPVADASASEDAPVAHRRPPAARDARNVSRRMIPPRFFCICARCRVAGGAGIFPMEAMLLAAYRAFLFFLVPHGLVGWQEFSVLEELAARRQAAGWRDLPRGRGIWKKVAQPPVGRGRK